MSRSLPANIILIGFMGCGKSTIGRTLARQTGYRYIDTDARLVEVAGCDIPTLFLRTGESAFRDQESRIVLGITAGERQVIATGGEVLRDTNVLALRRAGLVVYLTARAEVIVARTAHKEAERPLLAARGDKDLLTHVLSLLAERGPHYQKAAHLTVDTSDRTPEQIAAEIERKAEKWTSQP